LSYAVDERIDEFARAIVAILRRLLSERSDCQNKTEIKEKQETHAKRSSGK
jgi:hypothetical protein